MMSSKFAEHREGGVLQGAGFEVAVALLQDVGVVADVLAGDANGDAALEQTLRRDVAQVVHVQVGAADAGHQVSHQAAR